MNKQEKLKEVVQCFSGKWPHPELVYMGEFLSNKTFSINNYGDDTVCTKTDFNQCARELGYINGYRWGVEYPTNGKRPDLPDDVVVQPFISNINWPQNHRKISEIDIALADSFKITDQRYKPVNLDYLYDDKGFPTAPDVNTKSVSEIPESKSNAENVSNWYNYEAQRAVAFPPVGEKVEGVTNPSFSPFKCTFVGIDSRGDVVVEKLDEDFYRYKQDQITLMPLDHNRKAEAEKKRVVDAVIKAYDKAREDKGLLQAFNELYDAGFLRMPAE